jgi:hypothetical protein
MRLWCLFSVLIVTACDGDGSGSPSGPSLIFETDVRAHYRLVRSCRSPGEHSGLNAYTVWVNEIGRSSFAAIWETPPAVTELAAGAVVVKEVYADLECDPASVDHWVAMKKEPGFDPTHGNWHWQEVSADRTLRTDGAEAACIQCHTGDEASCAGYGNTAGRDYLCTAP